MNATTNRPSVLDQAGDLIELAGTYAGDGAFRTAANRLRQAADLLDQYAADEEQALAEIRDDRPEWELRTGFREEDFA